MYAGSLDHDLHLFNPPTCTYTTVLLSMCPCWVGSSLACTPAHQPATQHIRDPDTTLTRPTHARARGRNCQTTLPKAKLSSNLTPKPSFLILQPNPLHPTAGNQGRRRTCECDNTNRRGVRIGGRGHDLRARYSRALQRRDVVWRVAAVIGNPLCCSVVACVAVLLQCCCMCCSVVACVAVLLRVEGWSRVSWDEGKGFIN